MDWAETSQRSCLSVEHSIHPERSRSFACSRQASSMLSAWRLCCARLPQRWIFALMGSLAIMNAYTMRTCLSVAITEMVKKSTTTSSNDTASDETCPSSESTSTTSSNGGTYEWDEYTQGIILSSFYWGYVLTQIPGGLLAEKFGGKWTLGLGILSTSILNLVTPVVVQAYGSTGLIVDRFLVGLGEGATYPAISFLISHWAPPLERTKIANIVTSGSMVGTVVGTALPGVLIEYFTIGWPLVFYVFGTLGIVWFLAWIVLCYNEPDDHPFITEGEKKYINVSICDHISKDRGSTPWKYILTSAPVWACIIAKSGFSWGFHTMTSDLPKYMSNVLKFSTEATAYLSALPYVLTWLVSNAASWLADWLIKTERISRTNVRKIYGALSVIVSAIFIVAASYAGCDRTVVVVLFTFGVGVMGFFYPGLLVNPNDLSPNYSGTLMAVTNCCMALTGIATPYVVGVLTPNHTPVEWRTVFWISFGISLTTGLIFAVWGDAEVQHWNSLEPPLKKETKSRDKGTSVSME